ncbi:MAG: DUF1549 domain-containing protein, partial [Verrucomicrobia bacterium]|nr:DUF1549 domain-containing protein [Verrucomicrobiota bacterium]
MKFSCPHCSQHIEADAAWIGHSIPCPSCNRAFTVSAPSSEPPAQPPPGKPTTRPWKAGLALLVAAATLLAVWLTVFRQGGMGSAFSSVPVVELQLHPTDIQLDSAQDTQSIVVLENGGTFDVTRHAKISLAAPSIASVQKGVILPKSDGRTELRVEHGGKTASTHVTVTGSKATKPISFRLDVMPVLTKAGCNGGNCHGTSRGKEGFHLSLFGYDPDGDHQSITRDWVGRRINLAVPEESLILEKGLGRVPHGGGERFKEGSEAYQTLLTWLRAGAPNDDTNVAHVASLEILPSQAVLLGKDSQQKLTVRAKYTDGSDRDVTRLAVLFSNNESSAKVSEDGTVQAGQQGEAFVMARFETHTVGSQIIVAPATPPEPFPELSDQNYVDKLVHAKLRKLRITPSAVCDDATFARRAYLDITGTLPTPRQLEDFVEGMSSGKREQLVDELLQREEFADLWVMKFAELLQIRSVQDQFSYKAALQYYDWLGDRLAQNVPIDQVIRALITGSGSNLQNPAANYYQVQTDTLKLAENTAQVFMGMRIQCAQCHNHPFDRWTMNDYYGFASFFARIGRKPGEDPRETIVFDRNEGEMKHPVGGRVMKPKFLGGQEAKLASEESRREALADWIASPDNPWFARNLANIVWAHFMGRGIVEPVDDVRVSNPPSNPELLDTLGARFTEYKY